MPISLMKQLTHAYLYEIRAVPYVGNLGSTLWNTIGYQVIATMCGMRQHTLSRRPIFLQDTTTPHRVYGDSVRGRVAVYLHMQYPNLERKAYATQLLHLRGATQLPCDLTAD